MTDMYQVLGSIRKPIVTAARAERRYALLTWTIMGSWLLFCVATLNYNGPFFDEGIYVTAGQRTLEGHGVTDGYLGWFHGSLLWPILAALGYKAAGLVGTRMVALFLSAIVFFALTRSTRNLFGHRASFWAAAAFAISGPFLLVARLGVYDAAALAGIALSFWAITQTAKWDDRVWLTAAAIAFTLGVFSKYPMVVALLPLALLIVALRREKAGTDIAIFAFVSAAIALAFFLPMREQLASFVTWSLENQPTFGVTRSMIGFDMVFLSSAPALLALVGWFVAKDRRGVAGILLLSLAIWPAYHLLTGNPVSRHKHMVMGFLFAYPLVGVALSALWGAVNPSKNASHGRSLAPKAVMLTTLAALGALGFTQINQFNRAWPDSRPAADYLVASVQPGEKLLINESWPYTMALYTAGRIDSPWAVYDAYRIEHGQSQIDVCEYDWFVDAQGSFGWPEWISTQVKRCKGFVPVYNMTSWVTGLSSTLRYERYLVRTIIWRNTSKR